MACNYVIIQHDKKEDGTTNIQQFPCVNKYQLREIYIKHPDYKSLGKRVLLCNAHYLDIFGEYLTKESQLLREYLNKKSRYFKDFGQAKKYAEYFNEYDYKLMNYPKVDNAWNKYQNHKRLVCAYEDCEVKLDSVKKVHSILIDKPNGRFDRKLDYCSKEHREKIEYRMGIKIPEIFLPKTKKSNAITLDNFNN